VIFLYRLFTGFLYVLVYPYGRLRSAFGSDLWRGRLGNVAVGPVDLWIHAASVGEVKVVATLVAYLVKARPSLAIHVTVVTLQGMQAAKTSLPAAVSRSFFPFDAVFPIRLTLGRLRPRMILVAETEIWPNLILEASRRSIPVVLVNGRLSERSFKRYRLITRSMRDLLEHYDRFLVKTEQDKERLAHFVRLPEKLEVAGDMKFDAPLLERSDRRVAELRNEMGVAAGEFLLVAGSTRPGEESQLLDVYRKVKAAHPRLRLLLAPRHLERLDEITIMLGAAVCPFYSYGKTTRPSDEARASGGVILLDCMGILNNLYLAADLAFVGGTLVDIGGHNILEPVWARTPVVFGPHLSNVVEAAEYVERHKYGMKVDSSERLQAILGEIISGKRTFSTKTETDDRCSAAAVTCAYVLERLSHA
jgi:3-deoxy-D-manno-octulosonic-acid transferase